MILWLLPITQRLILDQRLPSSLREAFFHAIQFHHQIAVWKDLSQLDKESLRRGCKIENSHFISIMTLYIETGLPELLRTVRCCSKDPSGVKCSCRKACLQCSSK